MKIFTLLFVIFCSISFCQDFYREFPDKVLANRITKEKFPYSDAVIILKEQSINMFPSTVSFRSSDIKGPSVITSNIIIAKLLNEASVKRYGNFEYEYNEPYGNDIPFVFDVKARVLKPNGNIEVVNKKDIKNIVSLERKDGTPLRRKVLFDIPNLAVEDIVQIEYELHQPLSEKLGGTFYYNDRDYVVYSNAYLTLPVDATPSFNSFPQSKMPEPKVEQLSKNYGSGKTYFWSVQNLNSIPDEPFSFSFEDQSYLTAFTVRFRYNYLD